jgi:hypothetical protein
MLQPTATGAPLGCRSALYRNHLCMVDVVPESDQINVETG